MSDQNKKPETAGKTETQNGKKDNDTFELIKQFFSDPLVVGALGGLAGYGLANNEKKKVIDLESVKRERLEKQLKEAKEEIEFLKKRDKEQSQELLKLKEELTAIKFKEEIQKQLAGPAKEKKLIRHLSENDYRKPIKGYGKISID